MTAVFIGIVLIAINLDVGLSSYFLPAFGLMLIYTRLRNYRQLDKSFAMAGRYVFAMLICEAVILFVIATPLNLSDFVNSCIMIVTTALQACFFFYLMKGIQEEYLRRGDVEFKGTPVIGLVAGKILLILFIITGFKLGAAICGLAMIVFLAGVCRRLRQAERDLNLADLTPASVGFSNRALWGSYALLVAVAVFGGMFFCGISSGRTAVQENAITASVEKLTEKGMPAVVAQDLSAEDADALSDIDAFTEIKGDGSKNIKIRLIAGLTTDDDYKLVLWYGDLSGLADSRYLSREIIEISRIEPIASCSGRVCYTKNGKEFSEIITASKVSLNEGKILIREIKDIDAAETFYAEISLRNGADRVRGYLILDGSFDGKGIGSSVYTELFDAKIVQFPYKNEKQTAVLAAKKDLQRSCTFVLPYGLQ